MSPDYTENCIHKYSWQCVQSPSVGLLLKPSNFKSAEPHPIHLSAKQTQRNQTAYKRWGFGKLPPCHKIRLPPFANQTLHTLTLFALWLWSLNQHRASHYWLTGGCDFCRSAALLSSLLFQALMLARASSLLPLLIISSSLFNCTARGEALTRELSRSGCMTFRPQQCLPSNLVCKVWAT